MTWRGRGVIKHAVASQVFCVDSLDAHFNTSHYSLKLCAYGKGKNPAMVVTKRILQYRNFNVNNMPIGAHADRSFAKTD